MVVLANLLFAAAFCLGMCCILYCIFETFEKSERKKRKRMLETRLREIRERRERDRDENRRE